MNIDVEIETHNKRLGFELFETNSLQSGQEMKIGKDASIKYEGTFIRKAMGIPDIIQITLILASNTAASLAANWLYDKLKGKNIKVRIEREEIEVSPEGMLRVLREKMEKS